MIVSGHFNPLHGGHLDLLEAAAAMGDYLIVIVANDHKQVLKKGRIILDEQNRLRLIGGLRIVDEAILSIDTEWADCETLRMLVHKYHGDELVFANGGDRNSPADVPEYEVCQEYGIVMAYGVGGSIKSDSSTRINQALDLPD